MALAVTSVARGALRVRRAEVSGSGAWSSQEGRVWPSRSAARCLLVTRQVAFSALTAPVLAGIDDAVVGRQVVHHGRLLARSSEGRRKSPGPSTFAEVMRLARHLTSRERCGQGLQT